jgi:hypothetical protein
MPCGSEAMVAGCERRWMWRWEDAEGVERAMEVDKWEGVEGGDGGWVGCVSLV